MHLLLTKFIVGYSSRNGCLHVYAVEPSAMEPFKEGSSGALLQLCARPWDGVSLWATLVMLFGMWWLVVAIAIDVPLPDLWAMLVQSFML
jgi:hypothetical protein